MIFDLTLLKTLVVVVELKGFGKAAERLHRSPGAVSLQIKALEDKLGRQLFRKSGRQQVLTDAGEVLVSHARRMLALNDETLLALQAHDVDGEVGFGMPQDFADGWLPPTLAQFARAHRAVRLRICVSRSGQILDKVEAGELDLGLVFSAAGRPGLHLLGQLPVQWHAGTDFEMRTGEPVPLLVLDAPCTFRQLAIEALEKAQRPWRIALTSASVSALWAAAQAGLGVMPRAVVHVPGGVRVAPRSFKLPPLSPVTLSLMANGTHARPAVAHLAALVEGLVQSRLGGSSPGATSPAD